MPERVALPAESEVPCPGRPARSWCRRGFALRLGITALLLLALSGQVSWREVQQAWHGLPLWALTVALALTVLSLLLSAYKWRLLLAQPGQETPGTFRFLRVYLVGLFFNNFLPSSMGGDVVRVAWIGKSCGLPRAAASVVAERILAAVGLVLPSLLLALPYRQELGVAVWLVPLLAAGVFGVAQAAFFPGWAGGLERLLGRWPDLAAGWRGFLDSLAGYRSYPGLLLRVVGWSAAFQGVVILINFVLFRGMGIALSLGACILLVPLLSALAMLPLSINGLGLREWGYATLFLTLGVEKAASVAVSLAFFLVVAAVSLVGGVFYLLEK